MDKKNILSSATAGLKTRAPAAPNTAKAWVAAAFRRARQMDKLVFINIALLAVLCAMFFVMFGRASGPKPAHVRAPNGVGYTLTDRTGVYALTERATRPNRPTMVVVSRNAVPTPKIKRAAPAGKVITLPLRAAPMGMPAAKKTVQGNIVIDGRGRNVKISPMTTVNGNLYLQNLRAYVLPCGTRVNGHLFLRNVSHLKFCGCFDVRGNIYVSSNSSFGPLPKDAFLGGQVIF